MEGYGDEDEEREEEELEGEAGDDDVGAYGGG